MPNWHDKLLSMLPPDQRQYVQRLRTNADDFLDPEFRSDRCQGPDYTRVLLNILAELRLARGGNGPGDA